MTDRLAGRPGQANTAPAAPPPAWAALEEAIVQRRSVAACYHGEQRLLCPHALGWKNGRAKVLAYQAGTATSQARPPGDPRQQWRSMFVDEIENPVITDDPWQTADNYTPTCNNIDELEIDLNSVSCSHRA